MSQFSTNETIILEKTIDLQQPAVENCLENLEEIYEITKSVLWIETNHFQKVCLQFPDHLLPDSAQIALLFEQKLQRPVYVLADTNYESCCIDYVAAAHVNADAIIHYGPVCFSKTSATIPYLNIYEKHHIDLQVFHRFLTETFEKCPKKPEILLDTDYIHQQRTISQQFPENAVKPIGCDLQFEENPVVFIGNNDRKLLNLKFLHQGVAFYFYNPNNPKSLVNYASNARILKRRYFLIEKIKDSRTIGIIIGTLGVRNYLEIIQRLKQLFDLNKKKFYFISVGRPTVAKLANFPEIDVYVIVTCSLNAIYDNRDFYRPIVTPYDVEIALNHPEMITNFSYDFNHLLTNPINDKDVIDSRNDRETDVSLITGQLRNNDSCIADDNHDLIRIDENSGQLVKRSDGGVVAINNTNYGVGFLNQRTWKGLEQNLGNNDVLLAQEGRCGIAQNYQNETNTN